jgi:lauroyl/myristoyl acyltransferase
VLEQVAKAALMPVTLWYDGPYWCARIHPEIPVPGEGGHGDKTAVMTQQLADVFETAIARHPEDRHMLQKVFVADLDPGRLAEPQDAAGQLGPQGPVPSPGRGQPGGRRIG